MQKKTFRYYFILFTILYSAINNSHKEAYTWKLFLTDTVILINNPNRVIALTAVVLDYIVKNKGGESR